MHYLTFDYSLMNHKLETLNQNRHNKKHLTLIDIIHMTLNKKLSFKTSTLNQFKYIYKEHKNMNNVIEFPLFIKREDNIVTEDINYAIDSMYSSLFEHYDSFKDLKDMYLIPKEDLENIYDYHIDQFNQIHIPLSKTNMDMSQNIIGYLNNKYCKVENMNCEYCY